MSETNQDDDYKPETLTELIERLRRTPPRRGEVHKTFEEIAAEQGVGPFDAEWFKANRPAPFYEGFEEDIRRMRRGLRPLGPRK